MYLDSFSPLEVQVGYGELGLNGNLGYEERQVVVRGLSYNHALSTHPPARVLFHLEGRFAGFRCKVALNDDVRAKVSHADFIVIADGRQVALAPYVVAGESPRDLTADTTGTERLELVVRTSRWEYSHAVWLDPQLDETTAIVSADNFLDCLARVNIKLPAKLPRAERCIATVVSPGFEGWLDDMLGSLQIYGNCDDVIKVVFAVNADKNCKRVASKYGAEVILCEQQVQLNATVKAVMYSVARVIDAAKFICLDVDMLVLGDLSPLFYTMEACPEGSILVCSEANTRGLSTLENAIRNIYGGSSHDFIRILGANTDIRHYPLVVNDGIFAGNNTALSALDGLIRNWTKASEWVDERRDIWWRNQFIFNLALAQLNCGVVLDPKYNIQLHFQDVGFRQKIGRIEAMWHGEPVRVLHFNGWGRNKYPELHGRFARNADPFVMNEEESN